MASKPLEFFTICARNYAGQARTLAESISAQHPNATLTVWLLEEGALPGAFDQLKTRDIQELFSKEEYQELRLRYSVMEFCTTVKPAVFQRHFKEGAEQVIYLDPDIYLFKPLKHVTELMDKGAGGVLTPHGFGPIPRDGKHHDDADILFAGTFNLGFLALAKGLRTDAFLEWWLAWLWEHGTSDHSTGFFTDQKWLNFAPAYWPEMAILRHPGYNVAYWNLHERELGRGPGGEWQVNGEPIHFFHYSGYDPEKPEVLSKYQDRFDLEPGTLRRELLDFCGERLLANGSEESDRIVVHPFGIRDDEPAATFSRLFRDDVIRQGGLVFPEDLRAYGTEVESSKRFPRAVERLLEMRPDLLECFGDVGLPELLHWIDQHGAREVGFDPVPFTHAFPGADKFDPAKFRIGVGAVEELRKQRLETPVCITGMHRANTSMIAQIVNNLGVSLGPLDSFAAQSADNQDGYWEDLRFHAISEQILHRFGGSWDRIHMHGDEWASDKRLDDLYPAAKALAESSQANPPWGWKDPRASVTLPFWQKVVPDMKLLICLRSPVECAFSLVYRDVDNLSFGDGIALWYEHYSALLDWVDRFPSLVVHSDSLRNDPLPEVVRIKQFLGVKASFKAAQRAANTIRPDLRRSIPIKLKEFEIGQAPQVRALYQKFCELSGPGYPRARVQIEASPEPYSEIGDARKRISTLEDLMVDKAGELVKSRRAFAVLHAEHEALDRDRTALAAANQALATAHGAQAIAHQALSAAYADLERQRDRLNVQIEDLSRYIAEADRELLALRSHRVFRAIGKVNRLLGRAK